MFVYTSCLQVFVPSCLFTRLFTRCVYKYLSLTVCLHVCLHVLSINVFYNGRGYSSITSSFIVDTRSGDGDISVAVWDGIGFTSSDIDVVTVGKDGTICKSRLQLNNNEEENHKKETIAINFLIKIEASKIRLIPVSKKSWFEFVHPYPNLV